MTRAELIEVMARAISPYLPRAYSGTNPDVDDQHNGRAQALGVARSALAALEAAGVRLVPVEATEWMVMCAISRPDPPEQAKPGDLYRDIYTAMLAASLYTPPGGWK